MAADTLPAPAKAPVNGTSSHQHYAADPEAQEMVIESLRSQIQDLFTQVTQLNSKLVKSYDRVSDLEDELHVASAQVRTSSVRVSQLELERTQHLAALNTGLLVEKHHVTTELNRLMEKATEEAAQRGQAETARAAIEKDLDDLSASLFNQANTMVAEARYARHLSEQKAEGAEQALKGAEEAVSAMQRRVQALQEEKEVAERNAAEIQALMGKGKWVERQDNQTAGPLIFLSSHLPYQEFLLFVAHIRQLHMSSPTPPAMSTLLPLPFAARLSTEDSEPTVRLDLAPSLNWLSRRSVLAAIHNGQLTIEPISSATLLAESSHLPNAGISGLTNTNENIPCALCGVPVFPQAPSTNTSPTRPPTNPLMVMTHAYSGSGSSWSSSLFKKNANNASPSATNAQPPPLPPRSISRTRSSSTYPPQIYVFRISSSQTSTITSLPLLKSSSTTTSAPSSSHQSASAPLQNAGGNATPTQSSSSTMYPLCTGGWCLARLRTTCSLWAFVRTGIVDKIWEEELPILLPPPVPNRASSLTASVTNPSKSTNANGATEKPPVPPRKRGLWGIASAIGEKAASWSESVSDKDKAKKPAVLAAGEKRNLPPPPPYQQEHPGTTGPEPATKSAIPPPLPKRSEVRSRTPVNQPPAIVPSPAPAEPVPATTSTPQPSLDGLPAERAPPAEPESSEHVPSISVVDSLPKTDSPVSASTPPITPVASHHPTSTSSPPPPSIPPRAAKRLSASLGRPGTPSSVPLPESRPSTPPVVVVAGTTPSRTASPAIGGASSVLQGSAPPIPRRAAGRVPKKLGEGDSRPGSPAVPVVTTASPSAGEVQTPAQLTNMREVEEGDNEATVPANNGDDAPSAEAAETPGSKESEGGSPSSEAEEFVDAEDVEGEEKKGQTESVEGANEKEATKEETKEETEKEEPKEALVKVEEQPSVSSNDEDLPPAAAPPPLPPRKSEEVNGTKDTEKEEEVEPQVYVGDATWEERSWKELMRLKEEMFLARVGAVRS